MVSASMTEPVSSAMVGFNRRRPHSYAPWCGCRTKHYIGVSGAVRNRLNATYTELALGRFMLRVINPLYRQRYSW